MSKGSERNLVLYVDDERANRIVFEQSFRRFDVRTVASGAEALEVLQQDPVAVLVTDQRMPGMSGSELLERVKDSYPDTIRVVVTAYNDLEPILRAVNEGLVARYLIKPWDRAELEQILRWGLEAFSAGREQSALQLRLMQTERLVTLGSLSAAMLHDLKQPLSHLKSTIERLGQLESVRGALEPLLARHAAELPATDRERLGQLALELGELVADLRTDCQLIRDVTQSVNQFVHPDAPAPPQAVDPRAAIRYALDLCRESVRRARGKLIYEGPAILPAIAIGATELTQVLINLVNNAAQALERRGNPGGRVVLHAQPIDGAMRFVVADEGQGIEPEVLTKVGRPFFSTRPDGTGLGVAQCKRLVTRVGGVFEIESAWERGTNVIFTIPLA